MSNQRHVRKALVEFEVSNRYTAKDVLTHSRLAVIESHPGESHRGHQLALAAEIAALGPMPEPKPVPTPSLPLVLAPKNNLLTKFFGARGL
jgi:hypothetical protein